ncbi:MAG: hypothetical protein ACI92G_002674 [Candidatus Pelagisphaera sp.]|jgi:hypothetical protein
MVGLWRGAIFDVGLELAPRRFGRELSSFAAQRKRWPYGLSTYWALSMSVGCSLHANI